jgi:copper chaperone
VSFLFNPKERGITMQNETLKITGMTCDGCTSKVAHALKAVSGVHDVVVTLADGQAAVRYDESETSPEKMKLAVKGVGYDVDASNAVHAPASKGGHCG